MRYWEEQGLISPTREHGKLRYSPRDLAIARMVKRLLDAGVGIDGIKMLKTESQRDVTDGAAANDQTRLTEVALRFLYARKAFRESTDMEEEHYPEGRPPPPLHPPPHPPAGLGHHGPPGPGPGPKPGSGPR